MCNSFKTAIVLTRNELVLDWLEDVVALVGEDCCFFVISEGNPLRKSGRLFLKLNSVIFGSLVMETSFSHFNIVNVECNDDLDFSNYHTVLNFSYLKISVSENIKYLQFLIAGRTYNQHEVVFNTLTSYRKIELSVRSDIKTIETSTVRLDAFSIKKNTELILASFLVLVKAQPFDSFSMSKGLTTRKTSESISLKNYINYCSGFIKKLKHFYFYNEQWILGYSFNPKTIGIDLVNDIKIVPPKDRFWADPIIIEDNGRYFVFIEELIFKNEIAHLSVFELKEDGSYTTPKIILKKPYHLSYPYVFKFNEVYYMIPETAHNNDIQLYEAVEFPFKWEFKQNLMENVKASDTTLLHKDDKWWLFTSIKRFNNGAYDNDLSIFYSYDLFSTTWKPHKKTPIMQDISSSRQGGPFFNVDNDCYRVSQNCESNYGYGFNLSKLKVISETSFQEDIVYRFTPEKFKNILGVHTYNHINGKLRIYDILRKTFKY